MRSTIRKLYTPVASHIAGSFWLIDAMKLDTEFAAMKQQSQAALVRRRIETLKPVIDLWLAQHGGVQLYATVVQKAGKRGFVIHASLFAVVVEDIMGSVAFAEADIDQAAVDAMVALAPLNGDVVVVGHIADGGEGIGEDATESTDVGGFGAQMVSLTLHDVMAQIRRVPGGEYKGQGNVWDVLKLVTGNINVSVTWNTMKSIVDTDYVWNTYQFPGQGQHAAPVASLDTLIEIVMDCPGTVARAFRRQCAKLIRRMYECDETLAVIREGNTTLANETRPTGLILETESGTIVKLSPQSARSSDDHLCAVPYGLGMDSDITIPRNMAHRPGAYIGVKGCFADTTKQMWAHVKLGKHDYSVELRTDEHAVENEHWKLAWVGVVGSEWCTPRMIENKIKIHAKKCPYARILVGHQGEEIIVPLDKLGEFLQDVTMSTERTMAEDVKGMRTWGVSERGRDHEREVSVEITKYNTDANTEVKKHGQDLILKALERGLITPEQCISALTGE